jgi:hypothetical protein
MNLNLDKLKRKFEEDPLTVIAVIGMSAAGVAKLIDSMSAAQGRRAYAKQVDYRVNQRR